MKESQKYLSFFRRNTPFLIVPLLLALIASALVINNYPSRYQIQSLFQIDYDDTNINQKTVIVDQAVSSVRSKNIQLELRIKDGVKVNAVKNAPFSLLLITEGGSRDDVTQSTLFTKDFLNLHYEMVEVGQRVEGLIPPPYFLIVSLAIGIGLIFGLLISLVKEYFKNF